MGTTADKLAYLNQTKETLKSNLIKKEMSVPEGTTFRKMAELVGDIDTGSKVPLEAVTNLVASAGNAKVSLTWTDPVDKTATPGGEVVAVWAYTRILRKVGSAPAGPNDGVLVVESSIRNQYQNAVYTDTDVSNDVTYFYAAYAYTDKGIASEGVNTEGVTPKAINIYGVEWNGTDTTKWTRTDTSAAFPDPEPAVNNGAGSSPFDNLMPWKGMVKSEDPEAGSLVSIPKFWYKLTQSGKSLKIQISDGEVDGFSVSPAHMDRGDGKGERDIVYIGRYHCGSDFKSKSGQLPKNNIQRVTARTSIHNLGETIWQMDFNMLFTIWLLYLVEFADWNSQKVIGYGCGLQETYEQQNTGASDSMVYHTGTPKATRETYGTGMQYRNIEGLWDNVNDWLDGIQSTLEGLNIILGPNKFNNTGEGGNIITNVTLQGFPSAFKTSKSGGFDTFFATEVEGSDSTFSTDYWHVTTSGTDSQALYFGGNASFKNQSWGLFSVQCTGIMAKVNAVGCRLQKLP